MKLCALLLLGLQAFGASASTNPKECEANNGTATLVRLEIEGCPKGTCPLVRGTHKEISITFTPHQEITQLRPRVHGLIGFAVPYPIKEDDACVNSGLKCPLKEGETVTYTAKMPVLQQYPMISLKVKWELVSDDQVITCSIIPVRIVDTLPKPKIVIPN